MGTRTSRFYLEVMSGGGGDGGDVVKLEQDNDEHTFCQFDLDNNDRILHHSMACIIPPPEVKLVAQMTPCVLYAASYANMS